MRPIRSQFSNRIANGAALIWGAGRVVSLQQADCVAIEFGRAVVALLCVGTVGDGWETGRAVENGTREANF